MAPYRVPIPDLKFLVFCDQHLYDLRSIISTHDLDYLLVRTSLLSDWVQNLPDVFNWEEVLHFLFTLPDETAFRILPQIVREDNLFLVFDFCHKRRGSIRSHDYRLYCDILCTIFRHPYLVKTTEKKILLTVLRADDCDVFSLIIKQWSMEKSEIEYYFHTLLLLDGLVCPKCYRVYERDYEKSQWKGRKRPFTR